MGVDQGELDIFDDDSMRRASYLQEAERVLEEVWKWNAIYQKECGKSPTQVITAAQQECRDGVPHSTEITRANAYKPLMCTVDFHVEEVMKKWTGNIMWFIDLFDVTNLAFMVLKAFDEESAEVAQTAHTTYKIGKKVGAVINGEERAKISSQAWIHLFVSIARGLLSLDWQTKATDACIDMGSMLKSYDEAAHLTH